MIYISENKGDFNSDFSADFLREQMEVVIPKTVPDEIISE